MTSIKQHSVLIIGSGFAGLGLAIRLKQAGIEDFLVLEQADRLGGVWRDNVYPGVACDVESHLYSYSFAPNPHWSRSFARQGEILGYLEQCAERFGVYPHLRLRSPVAEASYDDALGLWTVTTADGTRHQTRLLVSAAGHALTRPVYPDIPGREQFAGASFHSARWNAEVPLSGKRVAVIGTGASAIQIVPSIAAKVGKLHVYQRSAPWIVPKRDGDIGPARRALFRRFPLAQRLARSLIYWRRELLVLGFGRPKLMKLVEGVVRKHLVRSVRDPELRKKLTPDYAFGCKRVLPSDDYYSAVQRPNVEVVTDAIDRIERDAIVTRDGQRREVDAIIYATGFEAAEAKPPFEVRGRGGARLAEVWRDHAEAYLGTAISGFPNLFLLIGPNCGLGHSSMTLMMEAQFEYVLSALEGFRRHGWRAVDVKPAVQAEFNVGLQERLERTVWNLGGCVSWYRTRTGRNTTLWPGFSFEFRRRLRRFRADDYELLA
jgi:cation diffusion facilitator CzcD-associated flavoprotein CzcO